MRQDERLRIISDELWQAAQARQKTQVLAVGNRVKAGMSKAAAQRTGAGPKFLLSSLLRCAHCGSSYAIAAATCTPVQDSPIAVAPCARTTLGLTGRRRRRKCSPGSSGMLSPEVIDEICRRVRAQLRKPATKAMDHQPRIEQPKAEIGNLVDAIAGGVLRRSPALATRLATAEAEMTELEAAKAVVKARRPMSPYCWPDCRAVPSGR